MKILLRGPADLMSGYGMDFCGIVECLVGLGHDVRLHPLSIVPPVPPVLAQLLTRDIAPPGGFDVEIMYGPAFDSFDWRPGGLGHGDPEGWHGRRRPKRADVAVLWTMWEAAPITASTLRFWGFDPASPTPLADAGWSHLWTPSRWCTEAFAAIDPSVVADVQCTGVEPAMFEPVERDWFGPMRYLMVGSITNRKDPWSLLRAWVDVYPDLSPSASLHLHTTTVGLVPQICDPAPDGYGPGVSLSIGVIPRADLRSLLRSRLVLINCAHGEGIDKPALEMLASGGGLIAGGWAGHSAWWSPAVCVPLDGVPDGADSEYFTVTPDSLRDALLWADQHRDELALKGRAGSEWVEDGWSWPAVADQLDRKLAAL